MHDILLLVPMATISDWIKAQAADAKTVIVAVVSVIILAGACFRMAKQGFSLGSILMAGVVAAIAGWLVLGGGIDTLQHLFSSQGKTGA